MELGRDPDRREEIPRLADDGPNVGFTRVTTGFTTSLCLRDCRTYPGRSSDSGHLKSARAIASHLSPSRQQEMYDAELLVFWWITGITPRDLSIKVVGRLCALFNLFD
jgi:hypothetical protein